MAITIKQLQDLLKKEGLMFFVAPDRPIVRFGMRGAFGSYDIAIGIQDEGRFLQFRTISYLACPGEHPHVAAVHRALLRMNYDTRLVKFGWDAADGEIVAYADIWVMDNKLTQQQLNRMLHNFVPAIDKAFPRLKTTMETGNDPGDADLLGALKTEAEGGGGLPPELRDLLEKLRKGAAPPAGPKGSGPPEIKEI